MDTAIKNMGESVVIDRGGYSGLIKDPLTEAEDYGDSQVQLPMDFIE